MAALEAAGAPASTVEFDDRGVRVTSHGAAGAR
jgi:hypothetical protein